MQANRKSRETAVWGQENSKYGGRVKSKFRGNSNCKGIRKCRGTGSVGEQEVQD